MKNLGIALMIIGTLRILFGYDDNSAVRMTWYAVEGMRCVISGSIFVVGNSICSSLLVLINKLNSFYKNNNKKVPILYK